jgi:hypothetical protein
MNEGDRCYDEVMTERPAEPRTRGTVVKDRDGDLWRRGNTRWSCMAAVDGQRVQRVGRLPWYALVDQYGPITLWQHLS